MWNSGRAQWSIVWTVALLVVLGWPPDRGRSLIVKAVNWAADPARSLPTPPAPLPMGLDDDGDAVAAHDAEASEYDRVVASSRLARWRMALRDAGEPFDPQTERQLLVGLVVVSALAAWRLSGKRGAPASS